MRIAITGATGMIGKQLTAFFLAQGHQIAVITRKSSYHLPQVPTMLSGSGPGGVGASVIMWDPALNYIEAGQLEGFDVIIHLAGSQVARPWSPRNKKDILESRVQSTKLLCRSLARLISKPKLLICASAVGFYGSQAPEEVLDEDSAAGEGFLAEVCRQWEAETSPAQQAGIRVVRMRLGMVLGKTGGALAYMRLPFKMGLGGVLGSGRQMISWVALEEIPYIVDHLIKTDKISGAVNVVSPQAVSNARFTEILGRLMHRPTLLTVPGFAVRLVFGEMGQGLLLEGAHVVARRLQESGYQFRFADLKAVLKEAVG